MKIMSFRPIFWDLGAMLGEALVAEPPARDPPAQDPPVNIQEMVDVTPQKHDTARQFYINMQK